MKISLPRKELFKKDSDSFVGINLGSQYLKGLVVNGDKVTNFFVEKNDNLGEIIKRLQAEKKIPAKKVKLSVKHPFCLARYFSFPKMDKKRMKQTLFYEINKYIPFSPKDVYFDFFVLKEINPSEVLLLLAVAKKDYIDGIVETFAKNNLKIAEINLDSVCLINLFLANYSDAKVANSCLLDLGYNFSTMTILHKGIPFLTRDIKFSIKDVIHVISRLKNTAPNEAEQWLLTAKKGKEIFDFAQDSFSNLSKEMKNSFDYFEVNKGEHIDKLYLSGGLAALGDIEETFVELLDVPTEVLNILPKGQKKVEASLFAKGLDTALNSFAVVFGLIV